MSAKIKAFFDRFEKANAEFDITGIASLYADVFMFGGPQGVQAVKKHDFLKILPRRKEYFKSVGLVSSRVGHFESSNLDSKYSMARVNWRVQLRRQDKAPTEIDTSSSYLLCDSAERLQIVFQIDHQDLANRIQELA